MKSSKTTIDGGVIEGSWNHGERSQIREAAKQNTKQQDVAVARMVGEIAGHVAGNTTIGKVVKAITGKK